MRAINQACSSFAADPKRRRCRCHRRHCRAKYDCLSVRGKAEINSGSLVQPDYTFAVNASHLLCVRRGNTSGTDGRCCFLFFFSFLLFSLPLFVFFPHTETHHNILPSARRLRRRKKEKKKTEYPAGLKASHHVATKTQRSIPSTTPSPPTRDLFFFFFEIPIFPPSPLQRLPTTARHRK